MEVTKVNPPAIGRRELPADFIVTEQQSPEFTIDHIGGSVIVGFNNFNQGFAVFVNIVQAERQAACTTKKPDIAAHA